MWLNGLAKTVPTHTLHPDFGPPPYLQGEVRSKENTLLPYGEGLKGKGMSAILMGIPFQRAGAGSILVSVPQEQNTRIFFIFLLTSIGWKKCMKFVTGTLPRKSGYLFYLYFNFDVFLRNLKTRETFYINVNLFSIKFWMHLSFPMSPSVIICPKKAEGFIYVKQFGEPIDTPFTFWRFTMFLKYGRLCDILQ